MERQKTARTGLERAGLHLDEDGQVMVGDDRLELPTSSV